MRALYFTIQLWVSLISALDPTLIFVDNTVSSGDGSLAAPFSDLDSALTTALASNSAFIRIILSATGTAYSISGRYQIADKNLSIETNSGNITRSKLQIKNAILEHLNTKASVLVFKNICFSLNSAEGTLFINGTAGTVASADLKLEACEFVGELQGQGVASLFAISSLKTVSFTASSFTNIQKYSNQMITLLNFEACDLIILLNSTFSNIVATELLLMKANSAGFNLENTVIMNCKFSTVAQGIIPLISPETEMNVLIRNLTVSLCTMENMQLLRISGKTRGSYENLVFERNVFKGEQSNGLFLMATGQHNISQLNSTGNKADSTIFVLSGDLATNISLSSFTFLRNQANRLLEISQTFETKIEVFNVSQFNFGDETVPSKGACFFLDSVLKLTVSRLTLQEAHSAFETSGLIITNSLNVQTMKYEICDSIFSNNVLQTANFIKFPGTSMYFSGVSAVTVRNSICSDNTIKSSSTALGGPCIFFDSIFGNLTVTDCVLKNNFALKSSSAIEFGGYCINLTKVSFANNFPVNLDYSDYTLGALNFQGVFLYIIETHFTDNIGSAGLFFVKDFKGFSLVLCDKSLFSGNRASYATIFNLDDQSKNRTLLLTRTKFVSNVADTYGGMVYVYIIEKVLLHNITFQSCEFIENESFSGTIGCVWIYSAKNVYNNFLNSSFISNKVTDAYGFGLFSIFGMDSGLYFTTRYCNFTDNVGLGGTIYYIFYVSFSDIGSIYINNYASSTGSIFFALYRVVVEMNDVYVKNASSNSGGFMFATEEANVILSDIVLDSPKGDINIFDISSFVRLVITNMTIIEPSLSDSGAIFSFKNNGDAKQEIKDLKLVNYTKTPLIISEKSVIVYRESVYSKTTDVIFKISFSTLYLIDASFLGGDCTNSSKGCLIRALDSSVFFQNILLNGFHCSGCTGIIYLENSNLNMSLSRLIEIKNSEETAIITSKTSNFLEVASCQILRNFNLFISGIDANIRIVNSDLEGLGEKATSGKPAVYCESCRNIELLNSTIRNLVSDSEAAGIVIKMQKKYGQTTIASSRLQKLSGKKGGAIYLESTASNISNCSFTDNHANQGGAIYFGCENREDPNCRLNLTANKFANNSALIDGGALKWQFKPPVLEANEFQNNSAVSGQNFSGFPMRLGFKIYRHDSDQELEADYLSEKDKTISFYDWKRKRNRTLLYDSLKDKNFFFVNEQSPGKTSIVDIELILLDAHNQVISHDIGAKVDCELLLNYSFEHDNKFFFREKDFIFDSLNYVYSEVKIFGTLSVFQDYETKQIIFENINFVGAPTTLVYLRLHSSSIFFLNNNTFNSVSDQHPNEIINDTLSQYSIIIPFIYSACKFGELYKNASNTCSRCPADYYTFSIREPDCLACPNKATCLGGADLVLEEGYWRKDNVSVNIMECTIMMDNCVGGLNNYCSPGYTGFLCGSCIGKQPNGVHYQRSFEGMCVECLSSGGLVILYILFWTIFITLLVYLSNMLTRKVTSGSNDHKIIFRIWINYLQVGIIMQSYQITIAKFLKDFGLGQNILKAAGRIWFSIECVIQATSDDFDPHLESLIISVFIYAGLATVYIINRYRHRANLAEAKIKEKLYICVYLLQPFYIDFLAANVTCLEIENELRLKSQPEKLCYTESYYLWFFLLYIPNLALWGLVLSFIIVNNVKKHLSKVGTFENAFSMRSGNTQGPKSKSKMDSYQSAIMSSIKSEAGAKKGDDKGDNMEELGEDSMFLWIGYRPKVNIYVWEIINWAIKCAIILINQIQMNNQTKYLIVLYIVSHYIIYQTIFNPYRKKIHNWLEKSAKYSLVFVSQTLLFLTFDLDQRLYDFSMAFSVIIAFIFSALSLTVALKKYFLKIEFVQKRHWSIFK